MRELRVNRLFSLRFPHHKNYIYINKNFFSHSFSCSSFRPEREIESRDEEAEKEVKGSHSRKSA